MAIRSLDDIEYEGNYTLLYLEGFGSKVTLYYNSRCVFKNDKGAGFTHLLEGYMFVPKEEIHQVVRSTSVNLYFDGEEN